MKKLLNWNLFKESWNPGEKWGNYLEDRKDLENEETISAFCEYNSVSPLVVDIWRKVKMDFGKYPQKLTTRGMVYSARNNGKIELEFEKNGQINLWRFRSEASKKSLDSKIEIEWKPVKSCKFSWSELKNMLE